MLRTLIAGLLLGGLAVGCTSLPQAPAAPPTEPFGTLEAQVAFGDYRVQEMVWHIATVSCRVRQTGPEQRQAFAVSEGLTAFSFQLAEGTASVTTEALNASGGIIGQATSIVGIRTGQVTLLKQTLEIGGDRDSLMRPLTPLPIQ